jgi:hypothetical protein
VVAAEIAPGRPRPVWRCKRGDLLLAIDDEPVQESADVVAALHRSRPHTTLRYTVLRFGTRDVHRRAARADSRTVLGALYFVLAAVGNVHAAGRRRRATAAPARSGDAALLLAGGRLLRRLHVLVQRPSRSPRLDLLLGRRDLDLALPPLFLHFTLVFPDAPRRWTADAGRGLVVAATCPAFLLGAGAFVAGPAEPATRGLFVGITRARAARDPLSGRLLHRRLWPTRAAPQLHVSGRRQLRWIAWGTASARPFALGTRCPYALGVAVVPMELSRFRSA